MSKKMVTCLGSMLLSALMLGQAAAAVNAQGVVLTPGVQSDDPWYISAGGAMDFPACTGQVANCKKVVGSQTYASAQEFYLSAQEHRRIGAFGYGVGHITSTGAKNWATYENRSAHSVYCGGLHGDPMDRSNWRTSLQRVCSIDGHVGLGAGYLPRGRNTSAGGYGYATNQNPFHSAIGLFMTVRSACLLNPANNCNNTDFLRWTCAWDTSTRWPNAEPQLYAYLPSSAIYMPRGEVVIKAEHGFFARETPIHRDRAIVRFAFNEYYHVSPANQIEGCDEGGVASVCDGFRSLDLHWIQDTDNHKVFHNVVRLPGNEGAGDTLTVLDNPLTGPSWTTCLDGDANDCQPDPECGRNMSLWAITAQEQKMWCWAAVAQAGIGNITGTFPGQCEIVTRVYGSCPPTESGVGEDIEVAAASYGVEFDFINHQWTFGWSNPVAFEEIKQRIDDDGNAALNVRWNGGQRQHWVWITGYFCRNGKYYVNTHSVNDLVPNSSYVGHWTIDHGNSKTMLYSDLRSRLRADVVGVGSFR